MFLGFGNQFFVIFPGFLRESTILGVKINFLVKFCSRYTYSEVRATKNCDKTICAARTWPPRALPRRAQIYIYGMSMVFVGGGVGHLRVILNGKELRLQRGGHRIQGRSWPINLEAESVDPSGVIAGDSAEA